MIGITLYIWYLIISFKYKEYQINSHIEFISNINTETKEAIEKWKWIIEYKSSKAYKNKIQKSQLSKKNTWENIIYLTNEETYEKYVNNNFQVAEKITIPNSRESFIETMTIFERWVFKIFRKDLR